MLQTVDNQASTLTATFPTTLRAAITDSGLSLDRIQDKLAQRGIRISVATLSYWQSGQRRPERSASLTALSALESLLRLPQFSLTSLVGPPRPRGRRLQDQPPGRVGDGLLPSPAALLLATLNTQHDRSLTRLMHQDLLVVNRNRQQERLTTRLVVRAERDAVTHCTVFFGWRGDTTELPTLTNLRNCSIRRLITQSAHNMLAAELAFDRPLLRGDTTVVAYTLCAPTDAAPDPIFSRVFRFPVREYLAETRFEGHVPRAIFSHAKYPGSATPQIRRLAANDAHEVHITGTDVRGSELGLRWQW
jgi:hypothetical protein